MTSTGTWRHSSRYADAGFDEIYISQMGGREKAMTNIDGFFDFYARDVLPKIAG